MPDPAALTHGVLLRVADFLRELPADQLASLADGTATLAVVPAGGPRAGAAPAAPPVARTGAPTRAKRPARGAAGPPPVPADEVRAELVRLGDRVAARRYLAELGLTVPQLRQLASDLSISVPARAKKDVVLDQLVQWTIGRRLDSEAIRRPTTPAR